MNAKDEELVFESNERILEERNDKMFHSFASALGRLLGNGSNHNNDNTVERAMLELQSQFIKMKEELDSLKKRVEKVEEEVELFQVIDRRQKKF